MAVTKTACGRSVGGTLTDWSGVVDQDISVRRPPPPPSWWFRAESRHDARVVFCHKRRIMLSSIDLIITFHRPQMQWSGLWADRERERERG